MRHYLLKQYTLLWRSSAPGILGTHGWCYNAPLAFQQAPKYVACARSSSKLILNSSSNAAEAIRHAILAVGAVHLRLHMRPQRQGERLAAGGGCQEESLCFVKKALDEQASTLSDLEIDMVLGALLSCTIASVSIAASRATIR